MDLTRDESQSTPAVVSRFLGLGLILIVTALDHGVNDSVGVWQAWALVIKILGAGHGVGRSKDLKNNVFPGRTAALWT
jgi:hypothetical protein